METVHVATLAPAALAKAVADHPFVRGLAPAHLALLTGCAMFTHFDPGQVLFHQGEIANRFYLIERGRVSVETHLPEGSPITVQTVGPGDVLGWSWLFPPYYWHFDACALEPTDAIFFYGTRLRETCDQDREFGYQMMRRVATVVMQRLQITVRHALRLAGSSVHPID
ncbi:MAG: Crp/Fnr family transcriptional regulator [Verrucomicrobiota bacterium]